MSVYIKGGIMNTLEKQIKELKKNIAREPKIVKKLESLRKKCECQEKPIIFDGDMHKYQMKNLKAKSNATLKLMRLAPVIEKYEAILVSIEEDKAKLAELQAPQMEV